LAFDQRKIGTLTAELMDALESEYGEDAQIGAIALVVEITSPERGSEVATKFSDSRRHVNLGLLEIARTAITQGTRGRDA
jgi:hypothetical protein